jgi:hypothetical protein
MRAKRERYYVAAVAAIASIATSAVVVLNQAPARANVAVASSQSAPLATVEPTMRQRESVFPYSGAIPVIYAYGKPYDRGVQIGKQLRALQPDMLREVAAARWRQMMKGIPGITPEESVTLVDPYLKAIRSQVGAAIVDEYIDEMRGVGVGAQLTFNEMFMLNLGGFYRKYFIDEKGHTTPYYPERAGCSSFAAWGKATADGKMIATHNCDWDRAPDRSAKVAVVMAPERGNRLVYAAPVGTWGSHHITSDRLFVAGLALGFPKAKPRYLIPEGPNGMLQRWIVQYSTSAQDAFDRYQTLSVGDRGRSYARGQRGVRRPERGDLSADRSGQDRPDSEPRRIQRGNEPHRARRNASALHPWR